jgi:hypothetical protein
MPVGKRLAGVGSPLHGVLDQVPPTFFRSEKEARSRSDTGDGQETPDRRSNPRPHPEAPERSGGLEGGLQKARGWLETSFEARIAVTSG